MQPQIGITLDPAQPTSISAFGPMYMVLLGEWNGASVIVERRLPERAGDPFPEGNWTGVPFSTAIDAPRQPASPYGEDSPPRIYWLYEAPARVRVVAAKGQPAPSLVMALSDPPVVEA